jgi:hypothetical protein
MADLIVEGQRPTARTISEQEFPAWRSHFAVADELGHASQSSPVLHGIDAA